MERFDFRRVCVVLAIVAFCATAVPADGAIPPRDAVRMFLSEGEQIVIALAERGGLVDVRILGTYSFFACGYGCRADEEVIVFSARQPGSGRIGEWSLCYDEEAQRISEASGRMSEHPSCRYRPSADVTPETPEGGAS